MYSVRLSKLTKGTVLAGLGEKGLRKRDGQVGPVSHPEALLLLSGVRQFWSVWERKG